MKKRTAEQIAKSIEIAHKMNSEREMRVMADMKTQLEARGHLSDRQWDYLESLLSKYSDETLKEFHDFKNRFTNDEDFRQRAAVVADYYIHSGGGYFRKTAFKTKVSLGFKEEGKDIPDQHLPDFGSFYRMFNNEYADKVWFSHTQPPVYSAGDLVMIRSTGVNRIWGQRKRIHEKEEGIENLNSHPCLIIKVNSSPIANAIKYKTKQGGARVYRVMPIGTDIMYEVMECDLKKNRMPKAQK